MWLVVLGVCVLGLVGSSSGRGLGEPRLPLDPPPPPPPPKEFFEQKLDHFDPTNLDKWNQTYYMNDDYMRFSRDGPVFLMIGGEGEASPDWMLKGAWLEYAETYEALCFQLEHRFYGTSRPTPDLTVESLRYLSSEQALADIAYFIEGMKEKHDLGPGNKWVVFGGSYPGSLAAWARLKYPHLVHAAISSSGPLLAKADFNEYFDVVRDSLGTVSKSCPENLEEAVKAVAALLQTPDGVHNLTDKFKLCSSPPFNASNTLDVSTLFENLTEIVAEVVQYNKDNRLSKGPFSDVTMDDICKILDDHSLGDPIDRLAALNKKKLKLIKETCLEFSYDKMIANMSKTAWDESEAGRQWTYQTCTEFGFFQTSSSDSSLFGANITLDYFLQQCKDLFNFNQEILEEGIKRSNMMYGDLGIKVDRVLFVHGSVDPWHALGITKTLHHAAPAILIQGTAHCADMYPSLATDLPQLTKARETISKKIGKWLFAE